MKERRIREFSNTANNEQNKMLQQCTRGALQKFGEKVTESNMITIAHCITKRAEAE